MDGLVFLHTADWHLGKPYARVRDGRKRAILQQERFECVGRIAAEVESSGAAFVVVAGDVFDSPTPTRETVSAACAAIARLPVPVLMIPGNHDHGGPGSVWIQEFFLREQAELAPNLRVLLESVPHVTAEAVIFPAPLLRQHESADLTGWIPRAIAEGNFPMHLPRIVVAHGGIHEFSATDADTEFGETSGSRATNLISLPGLTSAGVDYIALGDWHGTYEAAGNAWYAGTPEIDRFPRGGSNDPGHVLRVAVRRNSAPEVVKIRTSRLGWHQLEHRLDGDEDLDALQEAVKRTLAGSGESELLRLRVHGGLSLEGTEKLERYLESLDARLLRLRLVNEMRIAPSAAEIEALTSRPGDPVVSRVAQRLLEETGGDDEAAAIAQLALKELSACCRRDASIL